MLNSASNGKESSHLSALVRMNNKSSKGRGGNDESSEVDDLLRSAEDHLLLNLRVGSHSKSRNPFSSPSSSSSFLDSDLARRFDALKSPPNPNPNPPKSLNPSQEKKGTAADEESSGVLGDDLAARFAALKAGRLGPPPNLGLERGPDRSRIFEDSDDDDDDDKDGDGVSKKEVEKLMEWAKDAARLDPSSKSDDEEDAHGDDDDDDEDDSDDSEEERRKAKEKSRGKPKPKRWIFF